MRPDVHIYTHVGGCERNEDHADFTADNGSPLFILSDGLGGIPNGDQASEIVVEQMKQAWNEGEPSPEHLKACIEKANLALMEAQEQMNTKMKATLVVLALTDTGAICANVGDSRLYFITEGCVSHITEDHSVAYKKYKSGEITYLDINKDEDQSSLLRTMGSDRCISDITELSSALKPGDGFMLCSDGAWRYLYPDEILTDCLKSRTAEEWTDLMLMRVIERIEPGSDNLTIVTVKMVE